MQSIENAELEFPKVGLVRFKGPNNNGKSILTKTLNAVVSCTLNIAEDRNALVTRGKSCGKLQIEKYNGDLFTAMIARESAATYYELTMSGKQTIRRYIADKDLQDLVEEFGFHYDKKREVSLNIYNTFDPMLFINTSGVMNLDLLNSAITDPRTERAIANIDEVLKVAMDYSDKQDAVRSSLEMAIAGATPCDIEAEKKLQARYKFLYTNIAVLDTPDIPVILPVTDLTVVELLDTSAFKLLFNPNELTALEKLDKALSIPEVPDFNIIDSCAETLHEILSSIKECVCPLCKRSFTNE